MKNSLFLKPLLRKGIAVGMGLSVCYFITKKKHNGELEVTSMPDSGTTFIVSSPL